MKMTKEILTFGNTEIKINNFYGHKSPVPQRHVDIEKVLVSKNFSYGEKNCKYFIGYAHSDNYVSHYI